MATSPTQTNGTAPKSLKQLREEAKRVEAEVRLTRLKHEQRLLETCYRYDDFYNDQDLFDRIRLGPDGIRWLPIGMGGRYNRKQGHNWPFVESEQDLDRLRLLSRGISVANSYARGLLRNLTNYCINVGFEYQAIASKRCPLGEDDKTPTPEAQAVLDQVGNWLDALLKRNQWWKRERESYRRVARDGEAFLRLFRLDDGSGLTLTRFIEPEQVTDPPGATPEEGWSYGIKHQVDPFEDVETREQYHAYYGGNPNEGEYLDADEVVHIKGLDEDSNVKRGMPMFTNDMAAALERASKGQRNISEGNAIQAATAEYWEFETATQAQVSSLAASHQEEEFVNPVTGRTESIERIRPGTIRRGGPGQKIVPLPKGVGTTEMLEGVQGDIRQAASAVTAPEYLASASATETTYAAAKEAGAPFTNNAECEQAHFREHFLEVMNRALAWAVSENVLPQEALEWVEIDAQAPVVIHRDALQQAQADQILILTGVKGRRTTAGEWGLDYEKEEQDNREWEEQHGPAGISLGLPGAGELVEPGAEGEPGLPGSDESGATPITPPDQLAAGSAASDVRATVGGLQAISALQQAYYAGDVPREAAIANAQLLFGFSNAEASALFPEIAPVKLTPDVEPVQPFGDEPPGPPVPESTLRENCGTGAGGFQQSNTCAAGGGDGGGDGGGGSGGLRAPQTEADDIKKLGDDAIASIRKVEDAHPVERFSAAKIRSVVGAEAKVQLQKAQEHFAQLRTRVKTQAQARGLASAMGFKDLSGDREVLLKKIEGKVLNRIGAFVRPHA